MVDRGFHFGGPRFFLKILVDRGLVDRGSEKLSTTLAETQDGPWASLLQEWNLSPVIGCLW